jgi:predicted MPP superfamily phosphohydrolase
MKKRILSAALVVALLLSITGALPAAAANMPAPLRFRANGAFRILQVTDLQDGVTLDIRVRRFLQALVCPDDPKQTPDLIVLTGDNIRGAAAPTAALTQKQKDKGVARAIDQFMSILQRANVPIAVVFGNHDDEGVGWVGYQTNKQTQLAIYQSYGNCVAIRQDPAYENQKLSGVGNYNLPILASNGSARVKYNLWMFDAFDSKTTKPYDGVHDDVLDWYTWKSNQLKAKNGGAWVPALSFQHIMVPEIEEAMKAAGRKIDLSTPVATEDYIWEPTYHNTLHTNQFARMQGRDVKAIVCGHAHNNNYRIPWKGVDLINTGATCFGDRGVQYWLAYNRAHDPTARMITLHERDGSYTLQNLRYSAYEKAGRLQKLTQGEPRWFGALWQTIQAAWLNCLDRLLLWREAQKARASNPPRSGQ